MNWMRECSLFLFHLNDTLLESFVHHSSLTKCQLSEHPMQWQKEKAGKDEFVDKGNADRWLPYFKLSALLFYYHQLLMLASTFASIKNCGGRGHQRQQKRIQKTVYDDKRHVHWVYNQYSGKMRRNLKKRTHQRTGRLNLDISTERGGACPLGSASQGQSRSLILEWLWTKTAKVVFKIVYIYYSVVCKIQHHYCNVGESYVYTMLLKVFDLHQSSLSIILLIWLLWHSHHTSKVPGDVQVIHQGILVYKYIAFRSIKYHNCRRAQFVGIVPESCNLIAQYENFLV